jgi:hypothetical protein
MLLPKKKTRTKPMFNFLKTLYVGNVSADVNARKLKAQLPTSDESIESADLGRICVLGNENVGKICLCFLFYPLNFFVVILLFR